MKPGILVKIRTLLRQSFDWKDDFLRNFGVSGLSSGFRDDTGTLGGLKVACKRVKSESE